MWEKVVPSTIAEHLSANIFTDGGGAIQLEQHVGLQQVLGAVNLNTSNVVSRGVCIYCMGGGDKKYFGKRKNKIRLK